MRRRAMGAQDRRKWSSLVRQESVDTIIAQLFDSNFYGTAILGPRGVGKTSLARAIVAKLADSTHVIRLYGTDSEALVPYGVFTVLMARLTTRQMESPASILESLAELVKKDARGRRVVVTLDDLPGIDTASMGVIMHLVLTGTAKLMVMARNPGDLPEDLAWMIKDRLLTENRIEPFSREEVRKLLTKALGGTVGESLVTTLFHNSAGNPLVLHALVNEYLTRNVLTSRSGIWLLDGAPSANTDSILSELVTARLARESAAVNTGVEKLSLLKKLPLTQALSGLGAETLAQLEERGFVHIASGGKRMVSLAEPYVGEIVRGRLPATAKASLLQEISAVIDLDPATMTQPELLAYAVWIIDAGMVLEPELAVAAAQAAVHFFEPMLALQCCAQVPAGHPLEVQAAQRRSRAHFILANYTKSVAALEGVDGGALERLSPVAYASWAAELVKSLLWLPGGYYRIEQVLAEAELRLQQPDAKQPDVRAATKVLNLARWEYLVHRGQFQDVSQDLEAGSRDAEDLDYQLNCASLLTMVWAATGREADAVALYQSIEGDLERLDKVLLMSEWRLYGMVLALTWSGQWRLCESLLTTNIETYSRFTQYRGGVMELGLGMAYTYAGLGSQAAGMLLTAAAQLEVRDTYNSLALAYSALAFAFAQVDDETSARKFLTLAQESTTHTVWVNHSIAEFFQLMAQRWMGDESAPERLMASARVDVEQGRYTAASISIFGATVTGTDEHYALLEETSLKRQGPMPGICVVLARAHRTKDASVALEGAAQAQSLDLAAVESRCVVMALDLAHAAGDSKTAREAQLRLDRLKLTLPVFPKLPTAPSVKLTQRELQIARLAGQGLGNRAIATRIGLSVRTVEGHLYQVFAKFGISSREELNQAVES